MRTKEFVEILAKENPRIYFRPNKYPDAAVYVRMGGSVLQPIGDMWVPEDLFICGVPKGLILRTRKESKQKGYCSDLNDIPHRGMEDVIANLKKYGFLRRSYTLHL